MRRTLRISPAAVEYLEHQAGKRLGSSSTSDVRHLVYALLDGKLPKRKPSPLYAQSGQRFISYNRERLRIDFELTVVRARKLPPQQSGPMTPLEILVSHHGGPEYSISHHICDQWCDAPSGILPACPGQILRKVASIDRAVSEIERQRAIPLGKRKTRKSVG